VEEFAQELLQAFRDVAVYEINGLLVIAYALIAQWALVLSTLCAAGVFALDRVSAGRASLTAGRGVPAPERSARLTLIIFALWAIVALSVPMPVPALGLLMWAVTLAVAWLIPSARLRVLWQGKVALTHAVQCSRDVRARQSRPDVVHAPDGRPGRRTMVGVARQCA